LSGEAILIRAPMITGIDDIVRREVETLAAGENRRDKLIVVLETTGGSVEVVERISDVFRQHFKTVVFVVPNFAYSAGTVLCLSGDEIYMDYYSVLGPIDPQIRTSDGRWVPGLGYLKKYDELAKRHPISQPKREFLLNNFDPATLFSLEQAKKQLEDLIVQWLVNYKFKNWTRTETTGKKPDKEARAQEIAKLLGDAEEWKSHGRGIPMKTLVSDKVKLRIKDFGADQSLNVAVRGYYDLFIDYCAMLGSEVVVHTRHRFLNLGR